MTVPLRVAEELPINVAGLVVTAGVGVGVDAAVAVGVGVGEGAPFATVIVPVIPQHAPWTVQ